MPKYDPNIEYNILIELFRQLRGKRATTSEAILLHSVAEGQELGPAGKPIADVIAEYQAMRRQKPPAEPPVTRPPSEFEFSPGMLEGRPLPPTGVTGLEALEAGEGAPPPLPPPEAPGVGSWYASHAEALKNMPAGFQEVRAQNYMDEWGWGYERAEPEEEMPTGLFGTLDEALAGAPEGWEPKMITSGPWTGMYGLVQVEEPEPTMGLYDTYDEALAAAPENYVPDRDLKTGKWYFRYKAPKEKAERPEGLWATYGEAEAAAPAGMRPVQTADGWWGLERVGEISPAEKARLDLQRQQATEQRYWGAQQAAQAKEAALISAGPASWLDLAIHRGQPPTEQPFMGELGGYSYTRGQPIPGFEMVGGQPEGRGVYPAGKGILDLAQWGATGTTPRPFMKMEVSPGKMPSFPIPTRQQQLGWGPDPMALWGAYQQAKTGKTPAQSAHELSLWGPGTGGRRRVSYA